MSISVIAAADFEYRPLLAHTKKLGIPVDFFSFGIGALDAAANARQLATALAGKDVIYLGTCGTFAGFKEVELVTSHEVRWSCLGERLGKAYKIQHTMPAVAIKNQLTWSEPLASKITLSAASISLDATLNPKDHSGDFVENVELYSIATYLNAGVASLTPILGLTNAIGLEAHEQWKKNYEAAADLAARFVLNIIKRA